MTTTPSVTADMSVFPERLQVILDRPCQAAGYSSNQHIQGMIENAYSLTMVLPIDNSDYSHTAHQPGDPLDPATVLYPTGMASPVAVFGVLPDFLDKIYAMRLAAVMGRVQIGRRHRRRRRHSATTVSLAATPRKPSNARTAKQLCHHHRPTTTKPPLFTRCGYDYLH